jgi:hypothetical protein
VGIGLAGDFWGFLSFFRFSTAVERRIGGGDAAGKQRKDGSAEALGLTGRKAGYSVKFSDFSGVSWASEYQSKDSKVREAPRKIFPEIGTWPISGRKLKRKCWRNQRIKLIFFKIWHRV